MSTPLKIALYTLTRDRLPYTQDCFARLWERAGHPFDHFVIDNGSTDGTVDWLCENRDWFRRLTFLPQNVGISEASNRALDQIGDGYDLIVKMDNDCLIETDGLFQELADVFRSTRFQRSILSPRVVGIDRQPTRAREIKILGHRIGLTAIVGGLCHCVPGSLYQTYRYPKLPKASGQDDHFCATMKRRHACRVGYLEDLVVQHYETTAGQARRFPEYFARKRIEET